MSAGTAQDRLSRADALLAAAGGAPRAAAAGWLWLEGGIAAGPAEARIGAWLQGRGEPLLLVWPDPAGPFAGVPVANAGPVEDRVGRLADALRRCAGLSRDPVGHVVSAVPALAAGPRLFPLVSGVAASFNPWAWSEYIDPQAGVVRLAAGLGAALHDASGGDFARVAALGAPGRRPESGFGEVARRSQRRMEFLDAATGCVQSGCVEDVVAAAPALPVHLLFTSDASGGGAGRALTFDGLLRGAGLARDLEAILRILSAGFGVPVEIEFVAVPDADGRFRMLLLDVRSEPLAPPLQPAPGRPLFEAAGAVVGRSRRAVLERAVYVVPERYGQMPLGERAGVARLLGRLNRAGALAEGLLLGPGRWCTSSAELGVPAVFAEIDRARAIVEIVEMREGLVPEVSRGAHLLGELVARDVLYLAVFPGRPHNALDRAFLEAAPNRLPEFGPDAGRWGDAVRVVAPAGGIEVRADAAAQRAGGWLRSPDQEERST
jgi:hypothetical protein